MFKEAYSLLWPRKLYFYFLKISILHVNYHKKQDGKKQMHDNNKNSIHLHRCVEALRGEVSMKIWQMFLYEALQLVHA